MDQPMEGEVQIRRDLMWLFVGIICCFAAGLDFGLGVGLAGLAGLAFGSYNALADGAFVGYAFGLHQQMDQNLMDQLQQQQPPEDGFFVVPFEELPI